MHITVTAVFSGFVVEKMGQDILIDSLKDAIASETDLSVERINLKHQFQRSESLISTIDQPSIMISGLAAGQIRRIRQVLISALCTLRSDDYLKYFPQLRSLKDMPDPVIS